MGFKKPLVLVSASTLSLIIGLGTPALTQGRQGGRPGSSGGGPAGGGPGSGGAGAVRGPGRGGPVYSGGGHYRVAYYGRPHYWGRPYYYGYPYSTWFGPYGSPFFYAGWGWPYYGPPYGYYAYAGGAYYGSAALRLEVTPKEAEVYVDSYLAGTVDDFDGTLQRLRLPPGAHELTLYREGFRTVHQSLHLSSGSTFKVSYKMEPLGSGEAQEARPAPPSSDENPERPARPPERRLRAEAPPRRSPPPPSAAGFGTVAIRVQPSDAIVLIDGERWQTESGQDRLVVEVPVGPHHIEIRKEGFDSYSAEITTRQGETVPVNVSLRAR